MFSWAMLRHLQKLLQANHIIRMISINMISTNMISTNMISTNLISTNSSILCKEEHHFHNDLLPQDGNFAPDGNFWPSPPKFAPNCRLALDWAPILEQILFSLGLCSTSKNIYTWYKYCPIFVCTTYIPFILRVDLKNISFSLASWAFREMWLNFEQSFPFDDKWTECKFLEKSFAKALICIIYRTSFTNELSEG